MPTNAGSISDEMKRNGCQARRGEPRRAICFSQLCPDGRVVSLLAGDVEAVENCLKSKHFPAFVPDGFVIYSSLSILRGFYSALTWRR